MYATFAQKNRPRGDARTRVTRSINERYRTRAARRTQLPAVKFYPCVHMFSYISFPSEPRARSRPAWVRGDGSSVEGIGDPDRRTAADGGAALSSATSRRSSSCSGVSVDVVVRPCSVDTSSRAETGTDSRGWEAWMVASSLRTAYSMSSARCSSPDARCASAIASMAFINCRSNSIADTLFGRCPLVCITISAAPPADIAPFGARYARCAGSCADRAS
ncbi:hypothetical protein MLGJGCBP_00001 [Rhodococcus sp. T7]|nr:hypothetical protein MLGJGCBP_09032 [Rhodococcus sp. T7]KAF0966806.1 hypothetical protein MLGJGCBP_00001 [Rhodococcus sp. T7]